MNTFTFDDIIGQEHIKEHFRSSIVSGKINQAYLITGEVYQGKEFIAKIFANAVLCENPTDGHNPCGQCHPCIQAQGNNHPDIITVTHTKPNTITVDDIREQIVATVGIRPFQSSKKIYIMNEAEKMTPQAQNALLKTLEEPPEYIVIILLTTSKSSLLTTILSRCIQLDMRPVEDKVVRKYLMKDLEVPDYQADICVAFARGNIGKARNLATSEDFDNIKNEAIRVLRCIKSMDIADMVKTLKKLEEYKVNINDFLDIMLIWYRDVLLYKATMDADSIVFKDEGKEIRRLASESPYEGIEEILNVIDKTKTRLNANVNFELAMELMLLAIKEN